MHRHSTTTVEEITYVTIYATAWKHIYKNITVKKNKREQRNKATCICLLNDAPSTYVCDCLLNDAPSTYVYELLAGQLVGQHEMWVVSQEGCYDNC